MISAKIIADSVVERWKDSRLTTFVVTFPRIVLAELNTHRQFSRNSASSRAIPFKKMLKRVQDDPFIPIAWQKDHKGMQGKEYFNEKDIDYYDDNNPNRTYSRPMTETLKKRWLSARDSAINSAQLLSKRKVTKQLCNRLLEPFMWHTAIITASEFENFFKLRCPQYTDAHGNVYRSRKDYRREVPDVDMIPNTDLGWRSIDKGGAEIHIAALAEAMWDEYRKSKPKQLKSGEWHIPFGDQFDEMRVGDLVDKLCPIQPASMNWHNNACNDLKVKIATARCARVSYLNYEGTDDYEKTSNFTID